MTGPATFEELGVDELREVDALLDRANHDVAKYMAMTARNVDPEALGSAEIDMLQGDLCKTDGANAAWDLWKVFSQQLAELAPDPVLQTTDREMAQLSDLAGRCGSDASQLGSLVEQTKSVARHITELRRRIRRRLIEVLK